MFINDQKIFLCNDIISGLQLKSAIFILLLLADDNGCFGLICQLSSTKFRLIKAILCSMGSRGKYFEN